VTIIVGATAVYVASGQPFQPTQRKPYDTTLGPKPAKKWEYLTLTEVRRNNKDSSCDVFISVGDGYCICKLGWIEAGERLGMKLAPEHPRENTASYRASVLDFLGENGWELISVHKTEVDWLAWVFKRER